MFLKNIICVFAMFSISVTGQSEGRVAAENDSRFGINVLVVGLDNVQSNYFPATMITEETGIPRDSIGKTYNRIITQNIIQANTNRKYKFISSESIPSFEGLTASIGLQGEEETCYPDLSRIKSDVFSKMLEQVHADYILFLNQHYLKWQEQPLRTLFHIVSYSLYDRNLKEVTKGQNYFTSMNLEKVDKLAKTSRKSSSKIVSAVLKCIEK